jgi:hypothetical protein
MEFASFAGRAHGSDGLQRQLIRYSLGTLPESIGRVIAGEDFLFGVPLKFAAHPADNVAEVADLHVGDGPLSRLDAIEPVPDMIVAHRHADFQVAGGLFGKIFWR